MRLVPPRLRASFAWVTCTTLCVILYAQLKSWWEVGTFISGAADGEWPLRVREGPVGEYAASATMGRFVTLLIALAAVCAVLAVLERWRDGSEVRVEAAAGLAGRSWVRPLLS